MTPEGIAVLRRHEGEEPEAYPDPNSQLGQACKMRKLPMRDYRKVPQWDKRDGKPWTIGVGCTGAGITQGTKWSQLQRDAGLTSRIASTERNLRREIPWFDALDKVRQDVLVNIAFNVGVAGLLKWTETLGHVRDGLYVTAANDLQHEGKWNRDVGPIRSGDLSDAMRMGVWS